MEQYASKIIQSDNFDKFRGQHCTLGIDEAGRGPVLGPMVYAVGICVTDKLDEMKDSLEAADSKTLTEQKREEIFEKANTEECQEYFAYVLHILSPQWISASMLRRVKYNLNELSHDTATALIRTCIDGGIIIDHVYLDTVGSAASYQTKLKLRFPSVEVTVSEKADSKFPIVGAASICAKVTRDRTLKSWVFPEGERIQALAENYGSGYPGDPVTKQFLDRCFHPVFGFPSLVRFSWSTADDIITKRGCKVHWEDDNIKPEAVGTKSILNFFRRKRPALENCENDIKPEIDQSFLGKFHLSITNSF